MKNRILLILIFTESFPGELFKTLKTASVLLSCFSSLHCTVKAFHSDLRQCLPIHSHFFGLCSRAGVSGQPSAPDTASEKTFLSWLSPFSSWSSVDTWILIPLTLTLTNNSSYSLPGSLGQHNYPLWILATNKRLWSTQQSNGPRWNRKHLNWQRTRSQKTTTQEPWKVTTEDRIKNIYCPVCDHCVLSATPHLELH